MVCKKLVLVLITDPVVDMVALQCYGRDYSNSGEVLPEKGFLRHRSQCLLRKKQTTNTVPVFINRKCFFSQCSSIFV